MTDLIKNNYYIVDNIHGDDFTIIIYYLEINKCKIIIRRLDDNDWGQDLKIKIMDIENKSYEKISLGSCTNNYKVIEYYTDILLYKNTYIEQTIPKVIIQSSNYNMNLNNYHYGAIVSFIELNPEYQYKFFTDKECREYIKKNANQLGDEYDLLKAYDSLLPGSLKCDIFKYFYLYINGGCYFHCKMIAKKPLCKIIKPDDTLLLCHDDKSYYSGIIMVEQKNLYIYNLLKESLVNILNKDNCSEVFLITRKLLFYDYNEKMEMNIARINNNIYFKNTDINDENLLFRVNYKEYYHNYYNTSRDFRFLWKNNKIYYKHIFEINDYVFYYSLDNENDKFEITNIRDNIFNIKRIDCTTGWGQNISLRVIIHDNIYDIFIGSSNENEKKFIIF
jgi:hypothetical protein